MNKMAITFLVVSASTSLMLLDYTMLQPTIGLMLLPAFFSGMFAVIAAAHLINIIKQKDE